MAMPFGRRAALGVMSDGGTLLPPSVLGLCLLKSITADDPAGVLATASATSNAQLRRLSELASVCKHWHKVITDDSQAIWRQLAQEHLDLPEVIPQGIWKGLLSLSPGERVLLNGSPGFVVVRMLEAPTHQTYRVRPLAGGDEVDALPSDLRPAQPWRFLCLALGLLPEAKARVASANRARVRSHGEAAEDMMDSTDGPASPPAADPEDRPPAGLMSPLGYILPDDAFSEGSRYFHLYDGWQVCLSRILCGAAFCARLRRSAEVCAAWPPARPAIA